MSRVAVSDPGHDPSLLSGHLDPGLHLGSSRRHSEQPSIPREPKLLPLQDLQQLPGRNLHTLATHDLLRHQVYRLLRHPSRYHRRLLPDDGEDPHPQRGADAV